MLLDANKLPLKNPQMAGLRCMRCQAKFSISFVTGSCPSCRRENIHVNLCVRYNEEEGMTGLVNLPYLDGFSLGEGNTPIFNLPELAEQLGLATLEVKDESRNPSGSHKDRMAAMAINHIREIGAHTIVVGGSERAAVSMALYANAAGIQCEVAMITTLPSKISEQLKAWEAKIHILKNKFELARFVGQRAERRGYYALTNHQLPALGSAAIPVDALKAIASECLSQGVVPEHVMVPTSKGDLAWGMHAGFRELKKAGLIDKLPRLWIVEPFPRLTQVLNGAEIDEIFPGNSRQKSTLGSSVTFSQLQAAKESGGGALAVPDFRARAASTTLEEYGVHADLSAAACFAAVQQLRTQREIQAGAFVLTILTASSRDPLFN
jgi:threonine synthase